MYVVAVTPFSKGIKNDSLSYFSTQKIAPGNIVTVPLRKKSIKGLVVSCDDGKNWKQEIKDAQYEIKKVLGVSKNPLFTEAFIQSAQETANYFATSTGAVIKSLVPKFVLDNPQKFQYQKQEREDEPEKNHTSIRKAKFSEKYIIQTIDSERFADYKSLIRAQFAKNKSVFFCVPTIEDTHYAESKLAKGIEKSTVVLSSRISNKKLEERWNQAVNSEKPVLIIATAPFLAIPREDFGYLIVERENSNAYKTLSRPYFDLRFFAEVCAKHNRSAFLLGDLLLRAESLWRYDEHEFMEHTPIKFRLLSTAKNRLVDMKKEPKLIKDKKSEHPVLSSQARDILRDAQNQNQQTLLLVSRKGLFPLIVCGDCGETVTCDECQSPMVLYESSSRNTEDNFFKCHHCHSSRSAKETCRKCGSWKLNMLGFGIDRVAQKVAELIPEDKIFVMDKEKANTPARVKKVLDGFLDNPAGVLIGTEMSLLYLKEAVENVIVVSIDSMLSIPDFQIRERVLNILLRAKLKANENFLIQSRNCDNPIFNETLQGNLTDFYRQEFVDRKKFNYPPFSLLIKISGSASSQKKIQTDFINLKKFFEPDELQIYQTNAIRNAGKYQMNGLIKIPRGEWVKPILLSKLKEIPNQFKIEIDSSSIL